MTAEATQTPALNKALAELQTQLPHITKDQTASVAMKAGGSYRYKYADLAKISQEVLPLLGRLGLAFTSRPTMKDGRFVLQYELRHDSGEEVTGEFPLQDRGTPQKIGGLITYARRYCLCAVTGVAPEDDDTDAVELQRAAQRQQRRQPRGQQEAEPQPSPVNAEQQKRMQQAFQALGITDRDDKVKRAARVVRRPISSGTELTSVEAAKVIADLEAEVEKRKQAAGDNLDALWQQIAKAAPWTGDELEHHFCETVGRSSADATADDMRKFLASIAPAKAAKP